MQKPFLAAGEAHNKNALPERQVTGFQVERWVWDFHNAPKDPHYGRMENRVAVDLRNKTVTAVDLSSVVRVPRQAK